MKTIRNLLAVVSLFLMLSAFTITVSSCGSTSWMGLTVDGCEQDGCSGTCDNPEETCGCRDSDGIPGGPTACICSVGDACRN